MFQLSPSGPSNSSTRFGSPQPSSAAALVSCPTDWAGAACVAGGGGADCGDAAAVDALPSTTVPTMAVMVRDRLIRLPRTSSHNSDTADTKQRQLLRPAGSPHRGVNS